MSQDYTTQSDQVNSETITTGPKPEFFAWLPNCVVYEWGLSSDAIAAALYLNGKPAGWQTRPTDLKKHFNWGKTIWLRVSKELKECGLLHEKITAFGTRLWFELPEMNLVIKKKIAECRKPAIGKPAAGKPAPLTDKEILPKKEILNNKQPVVVDKLFDSANRLISKQQLRAWLVKHTQEAIEEKLALMRHATGIANHAAWVKAALNQDYKPSEPVKKQAIGGYQGPNAEETLAYLDTIYKKPRSPK